MRIISLIALFALFFSQAQFANTQVQNDPSVHEINLSATAQYLTVDQIIAEILQGLATTCSTFQKAFGTVANNVRANMTSQGYTDSICQQIAGQACDPWAQSMIQKCY